MRYIWINEFPSEQFRIMKSGWIHIQIIADRFLKDHRPRIKHHDNPLTKTIFYTVLIWFYCLVVLVSAIRYSQSLHNLYKLLLGSCWRNLSSNASSKSFIWLFNGQHECVSSCWMGSCSCSNICMGQVCLKFKPWTHVLNRKSKSHEWLVIIWVDSNCLMFRG